MTITLLEWRASITKAALGRDLRDRSGKARLANWFNALLSSVPFSSSVANPANLLRYIDVYGEQVTADALQDIDKYFRAVAIRGYTVGGLSTGYSPFVLYPSDVRPSNSAIQVIGEGLAGWHLERRGWIPIARPIGEGPDLVFAGSVLGQYALVEVKGTTGNIADVRVPMREAAPRLLQYTLNVAAMAPRSTYAALLVGVVIKSAYDFDLLNATIEVR